MSSSTLTGTAPRWLLGIAVAASLLVISYGVVLVVSVLGSTTDERRSALPSDAGPWSSTMLRETSPWSPATSIRCR
jgi:hypothetical protein